MRALLAGLNGFSHVPCAFPPPHRPHTVPIPGFQWEGVFVPLVPLKLMDILDCPVPALVGVQGPFNPMRRHSFDEIVVLDLDAPKSPVGG